MVDIGLTFISVPESLVSVKSKNSHLCVSVQLWFFLSFVDSLDLYGKKCKLLRIFQLVFTI